MLESGVSDGSSCLIPHLNFLDGRRLGPVSRPIRKMKEFEHATKPNPRILASSCPHILAALCLCILAALPPRALASLHRPSGRQEDDENLVMLLLTLCGSVGL